VRGHTGNPGGIRRGCFTTERLAAFLRLWAFYFSQEMVGKAWGIAARSQPAVGDSQDFKYADKSYQCLKVIEFAQCIGPATKKQKYLPVSSRAKNLCWKSFKRPESITLLYGS
jgi:hypothetical protein